LDHTELAQSGKRHHYISSGFLGVLPGLRKYKIWLFGIIFIKSKTLKKRIIAEFKNKKIKLKVYVKFSEN